MHNILVYQFFSREDIIMKNSASFLKISLTFLLLILFQSQLFADASAQTELKLSKTASVSTVEADVAFTYTLSVTNIGSNRAIGLQIEDTLPSGVTLLGTTLPSGWSCSGSSPVTCSTTADLSAGSSATIKLKVKATTSGTKVNNAVVSSASDLDIGADNKDSATVNVYSTQNADMQITKSAPNPVETDKHFAYTLKVKNNGPDSAKTVQVTDAIPSGLSGVSATGSGWSCSGSSTITCNYTAGLIAAGATKTITLNATAPHTPTTISNTADVTTASTDSNSGNNHSTKVVTVEQAPVDLDLHLGDSTDPVNVGDSYKYVVTVDNNSHYVDAPAIKVVTTLHADVAPNYSGYSGSGWSCNPINVRNVTCFYTPTLSTQTTTPKLYLNVTAPASQGSYYNQSKLYHDGTYIESSGETTTVLDTSLPADVRVRKTTSNSNVHPGDKFSYYIKVKNLSHANVATNVKVSDIIPYEFSFVKFQRTNGFNCSASSGNSINCTMASLAKNTQKVIKIQVKANSSLGTFTNTAILTTNNDNNPNNNQNSVDVTISPKDISGHVHAQKWSKNPHLFPIGDLFYFVIRTRNSTNQPIDNIEFTDTLPTGMVLDHITTSNASLSCSDDGANPATITCNLATLNKWTTSPYARIYVKVPTIAPDDTKNFTNTVRVTSDTGTTYSDHSASDTVTIYDPNADSNMKIIKTVPSPLYYTDDTFDYTISVTNTGAAYVSDVTVTDIFPSEISVLSINKGGFDTCNVATGVCTSSMFNPGQTKNIIVHAKAVTPGTDITNTVTVAADQDNDTSDNQSEALIDIIDSSLETDLRVRFIDSSVTIDTDTDFYYTLEAKNAGDVDAALVEINTTLPDTFSQAWNNSASNGIAANLVYVDSESPAWSCSLTGKVISCSMPTLAARSTSELKLKVHTPNQSGWIFTKAHIQSVNLDLTPSNNDVEQKNLISEALEGAPAMCYVEPPVYEGSCTSVGSYQAGNGCKQSITVKNLETSSLYDVKVFLDTTGYDPNYISECGIDGASSGCSTGSDVYFLNGNFEQAVQFKSPYTYTNSASHELYTINTAETPIFKGDNLFARYHKSGKNYYGALSPCPLPEPDPGNEPNYKSCGIFPDALNSALLNTFAFPTLLASNSYVNVTSSDVSTLTEYRYANVTVNTDATFDPTKTYNNTSRKLMLIKHLNVTGSNITLTFNAGNYYIDEFTVRGDNVTINTNGKVRFFIGGVDKKAFDVSNNGFNFNAGGAPSDLYVFATGELILNSGNTGHYDINGYFYSTKTMTIDLNSNASNHLEGAFSTENSLNITPGSEAFVSYIDTTLEAEGYGECPRSHYGDRNFVLVNPLPTRNILGDVRTVGNTVTCISDNGTATGNCIDSSNSALNENSYTLYTNIEGSDISIDGTTTPVFNSSSALIDISVDPSYTLEVIWAGLFWQGSIHNWNNSKHSGNENWLNNTDLSSQSVDLSNASQFSQNSVALHTPSMGDGEYKKVTASGDYFYDYYPIYETDYSGAEDNGGVYSVYTDVTDIIKAEPDPNGEYRVANLQTMRGKEQNLGNFGGWSLVVIYSVVDDPDQKFKNISVYSGYKIISANHSAATTINVSGFRTPKTLPIDSTLSLFAGEGEQANDGDYGKLSTRLGNADLDPANSNNLFRGIISGATASFRTPAYPNTNGIDIQNFDVSDRMSTEESSASIELGTDLDTYFPSMVTFATELHKPNICYDYAIKQNGHFLPVDLPDGAIPDLNQTVLTGPSNPLEFNVYLKNREGDIEATKLSLHTNFFTDPDQMHYINDSVKKTDVNGSFYYPYLDSTDMVSPISTADTQGVRVGIGYDASSAYNGGSLSLQEFQYIRFATYSDTSKLHMQFKLYLDMILKFNDGLELNLNDYALGSQIKRCEPSASYNPIWGQFTVVDHKLNQSVVDPANLYYNLRTQVSERPYQVDLVSLKRSETNLDITQRNHWEALEGNVTVHVELADLLEFSDLNASCGDSFNAIPGTSEYVTFGTNSWKEPLSITQTAYARPNLTYRVWFLEDNEGKLIQQKCGNPASSGSCYRGVYANTFESVGDTFCSAQCSSSDISCYECLRGKYGKALCSRDNFSIRPEAFDIEGLKDVNGAADPLSDLAPTILVEDTNNSTNTIIDHHIAARYPYRLDINATGYCYRKGLNTRGVPGYNNSFSDLHNISSFAWYENPVNSVVCADESDQNISLAFNNTPFSTSKTLQRVENIGRYRISLTDNTWTNVDKDSNATHHNAPATRNFFEGPTGNKMDDCVENTTFVPLIAHPFNPPSDQTYRVGCDFSSHYKKLQDVAGNCNPTAPYTVYAHNFTDYNVTSHPHHIDFSLIDNADVKEINNTTSTFVYMNSMINNINNLNMSTYVDVGLAAVSKDDNSPLSNFTENCYAQGLDLDFNSTVWHYGGDYNVTYNVSALDAANVKFEDFNASASEESSTSSTTLQNTSMLAKAYVTEKAFRDDMLGQAHIQMNLNLDRNTTGVKNPFRVHFNDINLTCTQDYTNMDDLASNIKLESCAYTADGVSELKGQDYNLADKNITFIYGRAHAPRYRVVGNEANVTIFYEAYCDVPGGCTLLDVINAGSPAKHGVDSVNWYQNDIHNESEDGNITAPLIQNRGLTRVTDNDSNNRTRLRTVTYDETDGYPYRTVMEINTSQWLIYNRFDPTMNNNNFDIEFNQKGTDVQDMVDSNASVNSNRRIMW